MTTEQAVLLISFREETDMSAETRNIMRFTVVFLSPFKQTLDDNLQ